MKKLLATAFAGTFLTLATTSPSQAYDCWISDFRYFQGELWGKKKCVFFYGGAAYSPGWRALRY